MSFTLIRHKDGKPIPIKLSIWDAFKGVPPPRPRVHKCPECGQVHRPCSVHLPAKSALGQDTRNKDGKPAQDGGFGKGPNEHNFTSKEDTKILKMKAETKTWAEIAEALGKERTKGMVQHRYKQIKPVETKQVEKPDEEKTEEKSFDQMTKAEKKVFKAQQAKEEGLKKREEAKKKAEEKRKEVDTAVKEVDESSNRVAAQPLNPTIVQSVGNDRQKWVTAASKHFDKTGQRITPDQARKIAEGTS